MTEREGRFLKESGAKFPIICGAMYPCSNLELVAAASAAGAIGIIQPLSLTYVRKTPLREGIRKIKEITNNPVGFNMLIESSSKVYRERMEAYLEIALEEGIRFFISALGNPAWVVKKVERYQGYVYHDVTERKFALKAKDSGVNGLICVNKRAGGHLGTRTPQELYDELYDLGLPLVCAGGISNRSQVVEALNIGYEAVQLGTRFIASKECDAHESYKQAIVRATANDIVVTEKATGVPLSVIANEYTRKLGTKAGPLAKYLLKHPKTKHWMRTYYSLHSFFKQKRSNFRDDPYKNLWSAGLSVEGIHSIQSVADIVNELKP